MNRRAFLAGMLASAAAPALVRGASPIPALTLNQAYAAAADAISTTLYGDKVVAIRHWIDESGKYRFSEVGCREFYNDEGLRQ